MRQKITRVLCGFAVLSLGGVPLVLPGQNSAHAAKKEQKWVSPEPTILLELWDKNNDGVLDSNEFFTLSYDSFDYNGDGLLDDREWYDYSAAWIAPYGLNYEAFDYYDRDHSNRITVEEYSYAMDELDLYSYLDHNKDGLLGAQETENAFRNSYKSEYERDRPQTGYSRYEDFGAFDR